MLICLCVFQYCSVYFGAFSTAGLHIKDQARLSLLSSGSQTKRQKLYVERQMFFLC